MLETDNKPKIKTIGQDMHNLDLVPYPFKSCLWRRIVNQSLRKVPYVKYYDLSHILLQFKWDPEDPENLDQMRYGF